MPTPSFSPDLRSRLRAEFEKRRVRNPRYSLRAFARYLRTDVSQLSKFLNGRRPLSPEKIAGFARSIHLPEYEIREHRLANGIARKLSLKKDAASFHYRDISAVSDSCSDDILPSVMLVLPQLRAFRADPEWIARTTGRSVADVKKGMEILTKAGLIEKCESGWRTPERVTFWPSENLTSEGRRKMVELQLDDAKRAVREVPIEERDHSYIMVACNREKIREAKQRISEFRRELAAFLEDGSPADPKDAVYHLSISLYPRVRVRD